MNDGEVLQEAVRQRYAAAARAVAAGERVPSCCAPEDGIGAECYDSEALAQVPAAAVAASIGCANPVAVADLAPGEVVLDLGSGGGIDVILSARRVGPTGKAYGLDMTDEMLELALANQAEAGVDNVEFLGGHMEAIPLPDDAVDVVLSNCVIALSVDKASVFSEAHRVLRPGGRLAVADVVTESRDEADEHADPAAWAACIAGALTEAEYRAGLASAGFVDVSIEHSHDLSDGSASVIVRASKAERTALAEGNSARPVRGTRR